MLNPPVQNRLIHRDDAQKRVGLGKTSLYERIAAGDFPQPVRLGRRIAFVEKEIDEWIAQRMAERVKGVA